MDDDFQVKYREIVGFGDGDAAGLVGGQDRSPVCDTENDGPNGYLSSQNPEQRELAAKKECSSQTDTLKTSQKEAEAMSVLIHGMVGSGILR